MKNPADQPFGDLKDPFNKGKERNQIESAAEKEPQTSGDILIPDIPETTVDLTRETTRRVMERFREGILACPHYDKFFEDDDDARII